MTSLELSFYGNDNIVIAMTLTTLDEQSHGMFTINTGGPGMTPMHQ